MEIKREILIERKNCGRVDKFLADNFSDFPRMFWKKEIEKGSIRINKEKIEPKYRLKKGDKIKITIKTEKESLKVEPQENISFKIFYQNKDFAIIDKPSGISVHPSLKESQGTLVNGLLEKFPQIRDVGEDSLRPGIVHRLDKETSGLMIVALNQKAFEFFKMAFKSKKIHKKYLALVWGIMKKNEGRIEGYVGKSKNNPIKQSFSQNPKKVINPKKSVTLYKVIERYKNQTLVEASPRTGRMHQIRVHFHCMGYSIVGDKKYFTKKMKEANKKYTRHLLHAEQLKFEFWNGQEYFYRSPLPDNFKIE